MAVLDPLKVVIENYPENQVDELDAVDFDYVVTVCDNARDNCPVFPAGSERLHWSLEDPAAVQGSQQERLAAFRRIRERLHERVKTFLREQAGATR